VSQLPIRVRTPRLGSDASDHRSYCGHLERPHHRCSLNVLLCELGHQAREAHQEDIPTSRTDTQNVFLCRPPLVEMAAVEVRVDLVDGLTVAWGLSRV